MGETCIEVHHVAALSAKFEADKAPVGRGKAAQVDHNIHYATGYAVHKLRLIMGWQLEVQSA
jgi:hypothetical protein